MRKLELADAFSIAASIGVLATGYFAFKSGEKAEKKPLDYAVPIALGAASIGCIWASRRASAASLASLAATAGYLAMHRDALESHRTEPTDWDFLDIPPAAEATGKGEYLCLEAYSGRWFLSTPEEVDEAIKRFNKSYEETGCASYNDLYDELGIQETHFGWQFGFNVSDGYSPEYINFNCTYVGIKGKEVYVIEPLSYPFEGWMEV